MDEIELIASHVKNTEYAQLTEEVRYFSKLIIIDLLGVAIAGSAAPGCQTVVNRLKEWKGIPSCTVIGYDIRLPSVHAAFVNSIAAHALDYDDTHFAAGVHATASIIPSSLAVAEELGNVSGTRFITSVALGVDLAARLGLACKTGLHNGFLPASMFGGFGSVAAAAKILDLSESQTRNAFGIMYSQMSGNRQGLLDGALTKRMQPAFAAMQSIYAASFSNIGITGAVNVISGKYGLAELYTAGKLKREELTDELGKRFEITNLSVKTYPCCRGCHPSIEGTLHIVQREKIDPQDIESVEISVSPLTFDLVGSPFKIRNNPQVDAQFSIPYTVAVAIIRKAVGLSDFTEEVVLNDTAVHDLAAKVKVKVATDIDKEKLGSGLTAICITCKNKKKFYEKIGAVKGDPHDPLTIEESIKKFRECASFAQKHYPRNGIEELIDCLLDLENVQNIKDVCTRLN